MSLKQTAVDALLYKNWFWWGLDLVADGLVLIFVAGTWYLLATLITGKKLYMENVARAALFVELVVSWTVWSHHLLSDQAQPGILKVASGETGHRLRADHAGTGLLHHARHALERAAAQDDLSRFGSSWAACSDSPSRCRPGSCRPTSA